MPAPGQNPPSSERIYVDGSHISANALPLNKHRRVFDMGAHMMQMVHKRAEDTLDYYFDLSRWLEPSENITWCRAFIDRQPRPNEPPPALRDPDPAPLLIENLQFADTGLLIWLRAGSNERRYTVSIRFETSAGRVHLLRFVVLTRGKAVKIAIVTLTVKGGYVGILPGDDPDPDPDPILPVISISDAELQDVDEPEEPEEPEFGTGPIELRTQSGAQWVAAASVTFSTTPVGEAAPRTVRIYNLGSLPVKVRRTGTLAAPFAFAAPGAVSGEWTIAAGAYLGGTVTFTPTAAVVSSAQLSLQYGTQNATLNIALSGTGEEVVTPVEPLARIRVTANVFYPQWKDGEEPVGGKGAVPIRLRSVNWFGAEGTNFTPHGTWMRRYTAIIDQIAGMGFNCIRLPFSGDLCSPGRTPPPTAIDFALNPEFEGKTALEILDLIIDYCGSKGVYVVLDHHRRQAGNGADGAPTDGSYTVSNWHASWAVMANRYKDNTTVVGADVHNEPHDLEWPVWASLVEACGNHIHTIAPDWIIFVEGVGHVGDDHYWWGGQLAGVLLRPIVLNRVERVAYSPHEYGQSVGNQSWLAYQGQTPPAGWPANLKEVWDAHWGFIYYGMNQPVWIGEMGGHFGYDPETGALNKPHATQERQWMTQLMRYLNGDGNLDNDPRPHPHSENCISFAWWSFNPNSGDTGGLVRGDWETPQQGKLDLIEPILATWGSPIGPTEP